MEAISPTAFEAFFKAQQSFGIAIKDSVNPHFKSKFADFASVWDAVSKALHDNGLFVTQPVQISDTGHPIVETVIRYKDGTVVERSQCPIICKVQNDPQAMGSAITYARRYSLASTLCVVTDDDDGNTASQSAPAQSQQQQSRPAPTIDISDWQIKINDCQDASDLNRVKKDIGAAKLDDDVFKLVWMALSKKGKALGATYDKDAKSFQFK
jgi:hypothetical protein